MDEQMREKFEAWYIEDAARQGEFGITLENMAAMREGDNYGGHRIMLNGKWEGWQACAAALSQPAAAGGWIKWEGGVCPVAPDLLVEVELAENDLGAGEVRPAAEWDWEQVGEDADIVAYRIAKAGRS